MSEKPDTNDTRLPDMPTNYAKRWLRNDACRPPCWEGIVPGRTTVVDAIALLQAHPAITPTSVRTSTWPQINLGCVIWNWIGADHGGEARFAIDEVPSIITAIHPMFGYMPGEKPVFPLHEVMHHLGTPTHINATTFHGSHGDGPFYTVEIIYATYGLVLEQNSLYRVKPILTRELRFDQVNFYAVPFDTSAWGVPWEGFIEFDRYCRRLAY